MELCVCETGKRTTRERGDLNASLCVCVTGATNTLFKSAELCERTGKSRMDGRVPAGVANLRIDCSVCVPWEMFFSLMYSVSYMA